VARRAVLEAPEQTQIPLEVLPGAQEEFVRSGAKFPAMIGGRGSGKTMASGIKAMILAGNYPGAQGVLTCKTFEQVRTRLMPAIRKKFGIAEGKTWEWRRADHEIRFQNGSVIYLRPANDPGRCRGFSLLFFGMDEAADGDQEPSFFHLQACLRQEIKDTEGKLVPAQGWVTTTPHWRATWIRKRWREHVNPQTLGKLPGADYPIFLAHTESNFFNPETYIEDLRLSAASERIIAQELRGEFIDLEGVAFPAFSERSHVRSLPQSAKIVKRVIGVDFGGTVPTAVVEFALLDNGEIQGTYEFYQRRCAEKQLVEAIADRPRCKVLCDPSGKELIDMLRRYGINAHKARSNNFGLRFRLWASRLNLMNRGTGKVYQQGEPGAQYAQPGIYLSSNQPNLISELQNLAFASARGDVLKDSWEQGLDDHAYDAGAYCLMELDPAIIKVAPVTVAWGIR